MLGATVALTAAGVLAYLVMALPSSHQADAGSVAAKPLVTNRPEAGVTTGTATPSPSTSPSASSSAAP